MNVEGDYSRSGYAHVRELISPEICQAFVQGLQHDVGSAVDLRGVEKYPNLLTRPAFELYGHHYKPMLFFLWGLTPIMEQIVGTRLLPTYDYLRIYREGDRCRIHSDRYSCEHSLSLTLDYSDGATWPLDVERARSEPSSRVTEDFGGAEFQSIAMEVGDAVLYKGVHHRHGRIEANPNAWSAHIFLHWVDRDGPYREHAFDGRVNSRKANFTFA